MHLFDGFKFAYRFKYTSNCLEVEIQPKIITFTINDASEIFFNILPYSA